jgi:hypothetical protein
VSKERGTAVTMRIPLRDLLRGPFKSQRVFAREQKELFNQQLRPFGPLTTT